jgi:hypothetical protein
VPPLDHANPQAVDHAPRGSFSNFTAALSPILAHPFQLQQIVFGQFVDAG